MSYDIYLKDPVTGEGVVLDHTHNLHGGTYEVGGTREAYLNVTYNYCEFFYRVLGWRGIRSIYGMTAKDSIPVLQEAADKLGQDATDNYWEGTEGNARLALLDLIHLAQMAPADSVWEGN
jgi:hypothetical protein